MASASPQLKPAITTIKTRSARIAQAGFFCFKAVVCPLDEVLQRAVGWFWLR